MNLQKLICSTAFGLMLSLTSQVWAGESAYDFNIKAQALSSALMEMGQQSNLQIVYFSEIVEGQQSAAISGTLTARAAMTRILANTDLTFEMLGDDTVVVEATAATRSRQIAPTDETTEPNVTTDSTSRRQQRSQLKTRQSPEEVVITGSNIRGTTVAATSLIQYDREDIKRTGYSTVEQLFATLPQNSGQGIDLRGLGSRSTLVLVNGRRIGVSGAIGPSLSLIPLNVIERIDILTVGASAVYGSDAIGGVVNFVLSDEFEGTRLLMRHAPDLGNDTSDTVAAITSGKNWSTGNVLGSYEFTKSDNLKAVDREYSSPFFGDLLPSVEKHNVFGLLRQDLSESIELESTGFYSDAKGARQGLSMILDPSSSENRSKFYGATLGLRGELTNQWGAELTTSYSRNELDYAKQTAASLDAKIDGTLAILPGGDAKFAAGAQLRDEKSIIDFQDNDHRKVYAATAETHIPLFGAGNQIRGIQRLNLDVALRHEVHSDNVGSSTDPKIDVLWSPIAGLNFHGSWGTSFYAPPSYLLSQSSGSLTEVGFPADSSGDTLELSPVLFLYGGDPELKPETATTWALGFSLEPSFIAGLDLGVTYFDIDYSKRIASPLGITNPYTSPDGAPFLTLNPDQALIDEVTMSPGGFRNFSQQWMPQDAIALFDARQRNLSTTTLQGLDLDAAYTFSSTMGDWRLELNGNYLFDFTQQITDTASENSVLGIRPNPVELRLRGGVSWNYAGMLAGVFLNYNSSSSTGAFAFGGPDSDSVAAFNIGSSTTADLQLTYDTGYRFHDFLENTEISLAVQNLFDEKPPVTQFGLGFDTTYISPIGRQMSLQFTKSW